MLIVENMLDFKATAMLHTKSLRFDRQTCLDIFTFPHLYSIFGGRKWLEVVGGGATANKSR